jgi:hypothetical protein
LVLATVSLTESAGVIISVTASAVDFDSGSCSPGFVAAKKSRLVPQKSSRKFTGKYFKMCKTFIGSVIFLGSFHITAAQSSLLLPKDTVPFIHIKTVPPQFYTQHLPFFCQKELQLQKITGLPVYIRLGTKEYVDYLEQKTRKP